MELFRKFRADEYAKMFSVCDKISYLSEYQWGYLDDILMLYGTRLEGMIESLLSGRNGESWGMYGTVYTFSLSERVKRIVMRFGIERFLFAQNQKYVLQNATLLRGEEELYSVCTHEGLYAAREEFVGLFQ